MRALLISTYDLGRQPLGLARQAAWLREAGASVACVDTSRDELSDVQLVDADVVAFYLPMHTATRLAGPLIERVRARNPAARLAAYGLYAPLNAGWLRERGVEIVLGPEDEPSLAALLASPVAMREDVALVSSRAPVAPDTVHLASRDTRGESRDTRVESRDTRNAPIESGARISVARRQRLSVVPDRSTLPPLSRYAALQMPDGTRRIVGNTDATRGCKHLCRHCPIVPVYAGHFYAVPVDEVMLDIQAQVNAGAQHITFGDPDFFNGPAHAQRVVARLARECPGVTYDVTIKIEHLLKHAQLLPLLRDTGCLLVTSAVESVDDPVLLHLRKGHTRADFEQALGLCRAAGLNLSPTFVPFTPWTTLEGYGELLSVIHALELADAVAPVQLGIRLLVTANSPLLELPDVQHVIASFDAQSLLWPWRHADPRVDTLQSTVMRIVSSGTALSRREVFEQIRTAVGQDASASQALADTTGCCAPNATATSGASASPMPPFLTEAWYCCAEPGPDLHELV